MGHNIIQRTIQRTDADGKTYFEQTTIAQKKGSEPSFVKMYLEFAAHLRFLNARERDVLSELLLRMEYDNRVFLPGGVREEICRSLDLYKRHKVDKWSGEVEEMFDSSGNRIPSVSALNVFLRALVKHKVIEKIGSSVYFVNPELFGKGSWKDISEIRLKSTIPALPRKEPDRKMLPNSKN
jgi:hypothetical protein